MLKRWQGSHAAHKLLIHILFLCACVCVSVLLAASVERVGVSRIRDFLMVILTMKTNIYIFIS